MSEAFYRLVRQWDARGELLLDTMISESEPALWTAMLTTGWLEEADAARDAWCRECGDEQAELVFVGTAAAKQAYWNCPACGLVAAELEQLRRWRFCTDRFIRWFATILCLSGSPRCLLPNRLWLLGRVHAQGAVQHVLLARGVRQQDFAKVLAQVRLPPKPLWICAGKILGNEHSSMSPASVVSVPEILSWEHDRWAVDTSCLQAATPVSEPKREAVRKRGSRTAAIEALQNELSKHLRSARSHAEARLETHGEVHLLPRPTQKQLARATGLTEVAVCRCLADPRAKQLRLLWEMAQDIEAVLRLPTGALR